MRSLNGNGSSICFQRAAEAGPWWVQVKQEGRGHGIEAAGFEDGDEASDCGSGDSKGNKGRERHELKEQLREGCKREHRDVCDIASAAGAGTLGNSLCANRAGLPGRRSDGCAGCAHSRRRDNADQHGHRGGGLDPDRQGGPVQHHLGQLRPVYAGCPEAGL